MKCLVGFWLQLSPHYQLLYSQLPVRDTERTLGELDFIVRRVADDAVLHLEVAVKFYLGHAAGQGGLAQMANWHGPSLQDRLDRNTGICASVRRN
ncbi:MAG: DUF1853 family protein [Thiolinea sp.]